MNTLTIKNSNSSPLSREVHAYNALRKKIFHPKSDIVITGKKLQQLRNNIRNIPNKLQILIQESYIKEKIISVKKLDIKSTFHVLFLIKTKNKKFILKINALKEKYTDISFYLEHFMQEKLKALHMPSIRSFVHNDFLLMEFITDSNIAEYKTAKNMASIYRKIGTCFKKIHAISVEGAGLIDSKFLIENKRVRGLQKKWESFFTINLDKHLRKSLTLGIIEKDEYVYIKKVFKKFYSFYKRRKSALLHNDPSTRNLYTDGKSVVGILDWEDAIVGDPLWEIAFIHTFLFRSEDEVKFENFCKGYGIKEKDLYKNPLYWIYYLRISLVKTISRRREGYYNAMGFQIDRQRVENALQRLKTLLTVQKRAKIAS